MRALLAACAFALAALLPGCGPASCSDACLDRCDEKPGACEPNPALYCGQQCNADVVSQARQAVIGGNCHTYNSCVADCAKVEPEFCGDPAEYCRGLPDGCSASSCSFSPPH